MFSPSAPVKSAGCPTNDVRNIFADSWRASSIHKSTDFQHQAVSDQYR